MKSSTVSGTRMVVLLACRHVRGAYAMWSTVHPCRSYPFVSTTRRRRCASSRRATGRCRSCCSATARTCRRTIRSCRSSPRRCAAAFPAAVALMDCPGHGERRAADVTDDAFEADIARRMSDAENYAQVRDDWIAVERAARASTRASRGKTGYAGFSMGAMFGLAIVADLPSVVAAVFALGGLTTDDAPQRADPRRRAPARRPRSADAQHEPRRALRDGRRARGVRRDPRPEAHGRVAGHARRHPARSDRARASTSSAARSSTLT